MQTTMQENTTPKDTAQYLVLNDDRKLCFVEFVKRNNDTKISSTTTKKKHIVLYFHGSPGYRHFLTEEQIELFLNAYSEDMRLISIDRPGWGDSDMHLNYSLMDFASDVEQLIDHLVKNSSSDTSQDNSNDKVSIVGYSAGGPFALACAAHPTLSKRIQSVVVVSSLGPRDQPDSTQLMPLKFRFGFFLSKYFVRGVAWILAHDAKSFLSDPDKYICENWSHSPEDSEYMQTHESVRKVFIENAVNAYSKQNYNSQVDAWECHLFARDWGFNVANISAQLPVYVYHGLKDRSCVPAMANYLVRTIPNSIEFKSEAHGHMYFFEAWGSILDQIHQQLSPD